MKTTFLNKAKELIIDYYEVEFGESNDISDIENVSLAYTDYEDGKFVQVSADLKRCTLTRLECFSDSDNYKQTVCEYTEEEMLEELSSMTFDDLIGNW